MIDNPLQLNTNGLGRRTSQAPKRVDFSKIYTSARIPNLIEVQRESYNRFLQMDLILICTILFELFFQATD